jgi:hypothetical protein
MLSGPCLFVSCVPNVARPVSVCIMCTQCCHASVCLYHVYPMLPGQCLFVSCVPNVVRPVSVYIMCTQCCQIRVCFYLLKIDTSMATLGTQDTYRHGPGNIGYTRLKQILAWQHWVHKIKADTGLATLGTHDINRHWLTTLGTHDTNQCLFISCVPNVARPVSAFILCTQCCQASIWFNLVYPMLPGPSLYVSCVPNVAMLVSIFILCTKCCQASV